MRRAVLACTLSTLLAVGAVHAAEPSPGELQAARDLFAQAQKDEEGARWAPALEKLMRVASVKMTPGVRLHIAVCEEKLGQLAAALADYTAAESLAKAQKNAEVLAAVSEPLAKMKARVPMLTLAVPEEVSGLEVSLDGRRVASGVLGIPMAVDPGPHNVEARAPNRKAFLRVASLKEREAVTVEVKLEAVAPTVTADDPKVAPPVKHAPDVKTTLDTVPPEQDEKPRSGSKLAPILTTGGAVTLFVIGIGAFVAADGAQGELRVACAQSVTCPDDKRGAVRAWDGVALATWIGAGVLAGVSVALWVASASSASTPPANARIVVTPSGASLVGRF
jgi:hypothetical protein